MNRFCARISSFCGERFIILIIISCSAAGANGRRDVRSRTTALAGFSRTIQSTLSTTPRRYATATAPCTTAVDDYFIPAKGTIVATYDTIPIEDNGRPTVIPSIPAGEASVTYSSYMAASEILFMPITMGTGCSPVLTVFYADNSHLSPLIILLYRQVDGRHQLSLVPLPDKPDNARNGRHCHHQRAGRRDSWWRLYYPQLRHRRQSHSRSRAVLARIKLAASISRPRKGNSRFAYPFSLALLLYLLPPALYGKLDHLVLPPNSIKVSLPPAHTLQFGTSRDLHLL